MPETTKAYVETAVEAKRTLIGTLTACLERCDHHGWSEAAISIDLAINQLNDVRPAEEHDDERR